MSEYQSPAFGESTPPGAIPKPRLWSGRKMAGIYDLAVVHGTYWAWWGCRWPAIADLYGHNVRSRHLELAPGTGYFLDRVSFPTESPELALIDLHEGPLQVSSKRLARYGPTTHTGDVFDPFPLPNDSVDSVGCGMMLHCLPGDSISAKAVVFDHVANVLTSGGRFFGTTVLTEDVPMRWFGRQGSRMLNNKGVFHNLGDTAHDLRRELEARFDDVSLTIRGSVGLWQATAR